MCFSSSCFKGEMVMRKTDFLIDVYSLQRTIEPIPDSGGCVCGYYLSKFGSMDCGLKHILLR